MFIEQLNWELVIAPQTDACEHVLQRPKHWHVLSVCGSDSVPEAPCFADALSVEQLFFDDITKDNNGFVAARQWQVKRAIQFARRIKREPLMIHCHAGISRSTALAWIILFDPMRNTLNAVSRSYHIVRHVRPCLSPNPHVLQLGINCLYSDPDQRVRMFRQFQAFLPQWP
jgi:predicted protein tyrosine phosphatase